MSEAFDYEQLCPGIREAVRWFHHWSWDTTDSGDGSHATAGMEGALDIPMVVVAVADEKDLSTDAWSLISDLHKALSVEDFEQVDLQAMFNPKDGVASILVTGDGLLKLKVST